MKTKKAKEIECKHNWQIVDFTDLDKHHSPFKVFLYCTKCVKGHTIIYEN